MNDNDILVQLRESFSEVRMDTPVEAIMAKAGARRHRRRAVAAAAAGVLGVALTVGAFAAGGSGTTPPASRGAAQLAAFTIVSGPNGGSSLTLRKGAQYRLDPEALRHALAEHGIPALVTVGKMCDSHPEPEGLDQAVSSRRLADGSVFTTFNPSALPAGSKISIGYFPTFTVFNLIDNGAPLTCTTNPGSPANGAEAGQHSQPITTG